MQESVYDECRSLCSALRTLGLLSQNSTKIANVGEKDNGDSTAPQLLGPAGLPLCELSFSAEEVMFTKARPAYDVEQEGLAEVTP